jgi:hypothetical protein
VKPFARFVVPFAILVAAASSLGAACGRREHWPEPKGDPAPAQPVIASAGSMEAFARPPGPHPRILLTKERLAAVAALRDAGAPTWKRLAEQCDATTKETIGAGYEGWDWVNAALALAICHKMTKKLEYAAAATKYLVALLDDLYKVGDGKGGDDVVIHDDGYPIRVRGCFGAIAYDWLYDAHTMTPDIKKKTSDRLAAWTTWFKEKGYNHDEPIANYYMGYFGAVAFGGIATEGDDPRAQELRKATQRMYNGEIVSVYKQKLAGGDFPEGWQYGDMVGAILAIFAEAENTAHPVPPGQPAPKALYDDVPWLRETVAYHAHALLPDRVHVYDTGDWSDKPAHATPHTLWSIAMVLPQTEAASRGARFLGKLADGKEDEKESEEWKWLAVLADDPSRRGEDPGAGATSYLAKGTGTAMARTDWTQDAVWVAMSSAPSLSDHQHLDAGHFEIVRGADALVIDGGGYGSFSSLSHNVIAVYDKKENDTYAPNQAVWSDKAHIARFEDAGGIVYAMADYASAYNPAGYPGDHPERSVVRAERELVFSRSPVAGMGAEAARVIVYDRVTLTKPAYGTTFMVHGGGNGAAPDVKGAATTFRVGKSAAWMTTLLPAGAAPAVISEPTKLGEGPFYANDPPEGTQSVRVEIRSSAPPANERRFLHAFVVGVATSVPAKVAIVQPPVAIRIEGDGADGAAVADEAYVFNSAGPQVAAAAIAYRAPLEAKRHVIASLAPNAKYRVTAARDGNQCKVHVEPGGDRASSSAGLLLLSMESCTIK